MRIGIIGRTEILYYTALLLYREGHDIPMIITAKEAPEYKKGTQDFRELAEQMSAQIFETPRIDDATEAIQSAERIDIGVSVN